MNACALAASYVDGSFQTRFSWMGSDCGRKGVRLSRRPQEGGVGGTHVRGPVAVGRLVLGNAGKRLVVEGDGLHDLFGLPAAHKASNSSSSIGRESREKEYIPCAIQEQPPAPSSR